MRIRMMGIPDLIKIMLAGQIVIMVGEKLRRNEEE